MNSLTVGASALKANMEILQRDLAYKIMLIQ